LATRLERHSLCLTSIPSRAVLQHVISAPPNKPLQRSGHDKVLGRGRVCASREQVNHARVLKRTRAVAERGR
jgi:hypothetical protein